MNYNSKNDFVVNLNGIWKWVGFTRKDSAKKLLEKYFTVDIDLDLENPDSDLENMKVIKVDILKKSKKEQKEYKENIQKKYEKKIQEKHGGHNKEQIMMIINTFKKFCLKAGTKKADEIHDYYIKLEELLHETINEETEELRNQLLTKDLTHKLELKMNRHNTLIEKFKTKKCVYLGEIKEDELIKIGSTDDIKKKSI